MVTNSRQQRTIAPAPPPASLFGRAAEHMRQLLCSLHGHEALLHFEQGRISLQCTSCGYESPGWDLKRVPAQAAAAQAAPRVVRFPCLGERRAA